MYTMSNPLNPFIFTFIVLILFIHVRSFKISSSDETNKMNQDGMIRQIDEVHQRNQQVTSADNEDEWKGIAKKINVNLIPIVCNTEG